MDYATAKRLGDRAVQVAIANLGYGETSANNVGQLMREIGGHDGEEWCALFANYCHRHAADLEKLPEPQWCYRKPRVLEVGAKKLVANLGGVGGLFKDPHQAQPGDLICWNRKTAMFSWQGHVGVVEKVDADGIVHTIEGNVGSFPAKVKRLVHAVSHEPHFFTFATLRK